LDLVVRASQATPFRKRRQSFGFGDPDNALDFDPAADLHKVFAGRLNGSADRTEYGARDREGRDTSDRDEAPCSTPCELKL
jgi:hypothetical protein